MKCDISASESLWQYRFMKFVNPCRGRVVLQKVLVTAMMGILSAAGLLAQNNWGWKQNRDLLAAVVEGRIQASIQAMEKIHREFPDNMETISEVVVSGHSAKMNILSLIS